MPPKKKSYLFEAIATLVGTIIGAGIFGIPYVVAQAGLFTGILTIVIIGLCVLIMYLYLGEVVLRTKGKHQMTGYAEIYLGKWGRFFMTLGMVVAIYGALIAYILGEGAAFTTIFGGNPIFYQIGFLLVMGAILYLGLKAMEESELLLGFLTLIVILVIILLSVDFIQPANLAGFDIAKFFIPYGVVLFAFLGMPAIPEIREELVGQEKKMKKAIILGLFIPMAVYILFAFTVVGVVGLKGFLLHGGEQKIATIALGVFVGEHMVVIGNIFAILAMATSFIALSFALMKMYEYDFRVRKSIALPLTIIVPFLIVLANITNFIEIISLSGIVSGGLEGTLLVLMFWKAKKIGERRPEYSIKEHKPLGIVLIAVFIIGALLALISRFQ